MKIYLVRHGATKANIKKVHQYSHDPLSDEGLNQAKLLAKRLKSHNIDVILSSPFERAKQTAEVIGKQLNKKIEYDDLLKEIRRPSEIEGKHIEDEKALKIKEKISQNAHDSNFRYSDEENFFDFKKRVLSLIKKLIKKKEDNILIISHGQTIAMLFCVITLGENLTVDQHNQLRSILRMNNTGITIFSYLDNKWKLLTWNDTNHL